MRYVRGVFRLVLRQYSPAPVCGVFYWRYALKLCLGLAPWTNSTLDVAPVLVLAEMPEETLTEFLKPCVRVALIGE